MRFTGFVPVLAALVLALSARPAAAQDDGGSPSRSKSPAAPTPSVSRIAKANEAVASADHLAKTRRYSEAIVHYRRALRIYRRERDPRAAELGKRLSELSKDLGVLVVDAAAVAKIAYLEVAVDGKIVPTDQLDKGVMLRSGKHRLAARRPACSEWLSEFTVKPGGSVRLAVPELACDTDTSTVVNWNAAPSRWRAGGPSPWLSGFALGDRRAGSRRGLLVWGPVLVGAGAGLYLWGTSMDRIANPLRPVVRLSGIAVGVGGLAAIGIYFATRGSGGNGVAVAPLVDPRGSRGAAVTWAGVW